ncbi:AMP-binding protein [Paucibacter sp. APW11]|uniref:AMP-binding protein n=1 Tax=Roseateles aquae TaxID=3077235 RepID=A0ABU3P587_9BURK|nr:AMP-binding protein [Paucibacter sp. APW11]MDT8997739.1 AMP-binding protein [Paucibacter sp. APW11]
MDTLEQRWLPVHAQLAEQASSRPDAPFLLADGGISYASAAAWVAHISTTHLQRFSGQRVALCLDKGNAYALSILAALYANCSYVPIDGAQPAQRVAMILADAAPTVLICDHSHACSLIELGLPDSVVLLLVHSELPLPESAAVPAGVEVHHLAHHLAHPSVQPATGESLALPDTSACQPGDLAALLYTSGSTGSPKGVQLSHLNLSNFVQWAVAELRLTPSDRLLNLASFNFDLSTFDLFGSLLAGASLYVSHERESAHVSRVGELLREQAITTIYSVPSMFALLNRSAAWPALDAQALRHLVFAGEVMPKPQLKLMAKAVSPACQLYNFYGPTETNVCLFHRVSAEDLACDEPLPIGQPIDGATVWLVDEHGHYRADEGAVGEVWVAGRCVTPGYWQRQDPRNALNHQRGMHATGDYGEWQGGRLLYRGRIDRMLKLSGYRVELGEIESILARHPQLQEVAVIAESVNPPKLVAHYVSRDPEQRLGALELKAFCAAHLPKYMVPHVLIQRTALPKNANGKIDYRALREGQEPVTA